MGSILTPLLTSLEQSNALPNACTSCGRCAEVCPADIPLPDLLRDLRHDETRQKLSSSRWRTGLRLHAWLARQPTLYRACTSLGIFTLHLLGRRKGGFSRLPLAAGWTSQRDFPAPEGRTFMQQYAAIQREEKAREHKAAQAAAQLQSAEQAGPDPVIPSESRPRRAAPAAAGRAAPARAKPRRSPRGQAPTERIEPSLGTDWSDDETGGQGRE
jgi:ferredoxin